MANEKDVPKPGTIAWGGFLNFLDNLKKAGVPTQIDNVVLSKMSGSGRSQLRATLQYFGLIDEKYVVQDSLVELVSADEEERKVLIGRLLRERYSFLFDSKNGFDLSRSTAKEFTDKFAKYYSGDSRAKAESFFLKGASYAGIPVSTYITQNRTWPRRERKKGTSLGDNGSARQEAQKDRDPNEEETPFQQRGNGQPGHQDTKLFDGPYGILHKLQIEKLPGNGQWTSEERDNYVESYLALLKMLVKVVDPPSDI